MVPHGGALDVMTNGKCRAMGIGSAAACHGSEPNGIAVLTVPVLHTPRRHDQQSHVWRLRAFGERAVYAGVPVFGQGSFRCPNQIRLFRPGTTVRLPVYGESAE